MSRDAFRQLSDGSTDLAGVPTVHLHLVTGDAQGVHRLGSRDAGTLVDVLEHLWSEVGHAQEYARADLI